MSRVYASQEFCPVARTLDIVGDRWTFLVLRDLSLGRSRYNELLQSCSGISTNLLSDRLKKLEERGFVQRALYSDHPPRAEYRLTDRDGTEFGSRRLHKCSAESPNRRPDRTGEYDFAHNKPPVWRNHHTVSVLAAMQLTLSSGGG